MRHPSLCSSACPSRTTSRSRPPLRGLRARPRDLWREGGVHRVFAGREVRIEAAPGGVDVTPHDADDRGAGAAVPRRCRSISTASTPGQRRRDARPPRDRARRLPPAAPAQPVRGARHLDHRAAGLAPVGGGDPQPFIERYGVPAEHAHRLPRARAGRARDRGRADRRRLLDPQGGVRRRARAQRPRPRRARGAARRGGDRAPRRDPRPRRMDRGLVPRPPPGAAARLARRRPGTAEGGRRVLW